MTMKREEFELEYANRHMRYDPRSIESKVESVNRLAEINGYSDSHIDLCWKIQKIKNTPLRMDRAELIMELDW